MTRCTGQTVVLESPTIPDFSSESASDGLFDLQSGALTISVGDIPVCACGELVATTVVIYNGEHDYDAEAIYSATLSP
jgi:hypothetical protein